MASLGSNIVQILIQGTDRATPAMNSAALSMNNLASIAKKTAAVLGIGFSARALLDFAKQAVDTADETGKLAQKLGATTEFVSALTYNAGLNEVAVDGVQRGMKALNEAMSTGSKEFVALGISGRSLEQVLPQIADRFADMADGADKNTLATKLFGKAGMDLIPMLNQGAAGMKAAAEEAKRFGLIVDQESAVAADEFNDNLTKLQAQARGFANQVMQDVIPSLVEWTAKLVKLNEAHDISGKVVTSVSDAARASALTWDMASIAATGYIAAMTHIKEAVSIFSEKGSGERLGELVKSMSEVLTTAAEIKRAFKDSIWEEIGDKLDLPKLEADGSYTITRTTKDDAAPTTGDKTAYFKLLNELQVAALDGEAKMVLAEHHAHGERLQKITELTQAHGDGNLLRELEEERHQQALKNLDQGRQELRMVALGLYQEANRNLFSYIATAAQTVNQGLSSALTNIITGAQTAKEAFSQLGKQMINMIVGFMTQRAVAWALEKALSAVGLGVIKAAALASVGVAAGVAAAWAAAATASAIATGGGSLAAAAGVPLAMAANAAAGSTIALAGALGGAAHGGLDYIPNESTWLLQRGERVLSPKQNEDLTDYISEQSQGGGYGGERVLSPRQNQDYMDMGRTGPVETNGGGMIQNAVYLDGRMILEFISEASRDGRLAVSPRAIV